MFCSWVTFWLTKTEKGGEIPARTSLGATTVLTVVTIGFGGKSKPQVSTLHVCIAVNTAYQIYKFHFKGGKS